MEEVNLSTWSAFQARLDGTEASLPVSYTETNDRYVVFAGQIPSVYRFEIFKDGQEPDFLTGDALTANTSARTDFLASWKGKADTQMSAAAPVASVVKHFNGELDDGEVRTINFGGTSSEILIQNMTRNRYLLVSLDGGNGYKSIEGRSALSIRLAVDSIKIRPSKNPAYENDYEDDDNSGADYEIVVVL